MEVIQVIIIIIISDVCYDDIVASQFKQWLMLLLPQSLMLLHVSCYCVTICCCSNWDSEHSGCRWWRLS